MQCPKCQFENPGELNFCGECGAKLERLCPNCNSSSPPNFKFCGECGHKFEVPVETSPKKLSFDEKIDKIQRYLPKGITDKILSQRGKIEGERKQVTVMFCDMEQFTSLVEKLGAEEAYNLMDQIYEILIHKVHDYEGTVNEMTGDGVMALFGAPVALEDAPQRAIRSAHGIHREMTRVSNKMKQEKANIPSLKMRIGIHTGPVVVGTLGNDLRVEFKAVGDTVNLASRMEGLAEPGSTYVTEDTFRLTEGLFRFEALGEHKVKGRADAVKAYRVIAPSTSRTRFDVSAERGLTPFVGRERELEILLDAFERAKTGRGQVISIMSEAGVGKSRLLYEFRKAVTNEDVTFLEGKCLSYSRGVAYHPVIDILKSNFYTLDVDGDTEIVEKVKKGLKILGVDEASTLPYFLELLSVKDSGIDKIMMSPEGKRDRIIEALKRIVLKVSEIRPLIMAIEDLHWVDKSSEDVLKYLLESIPGATIFLIFTYRPEFVQTWGSKSFHNQLTLNRLSNWESLAMVTHILGTEEIDSDLEDLILEKTEGIPFFIEEFIRSLKELEIIERKDNRSHLIKDTQDLTIPSTIQDVIMARVDSLPDEAKEVLQAGSAIEREFSHDLIKQVTALPEKKLMSSLSTLKESELLYERGIYPQSIYIFKHALTREVVYDSILTKRKNKLHDDIGNAIEQLYKENIGEQYGVLVKHFTESGNYKKAAEYSKLATKKAVKTASLNDAISYAKIRIAALEESPQKDELHKKIIDARTSFGLYNLTMNYFKEAKEAIVPIEKLAIKHDYKRRLSQIYTILGACNHLVEEDLPEAFKNLEEALKISEEINDIVSYYLANFWLGYALSFNCEYEKAFRYMMKALEISVASNFLWSISLIKSNISYYVYNIQGMFNDGYKTSVEALKIANESDDILSKAVANICHGYSCFGKGSLEDAQVHLLKGVDLSEKINLFAWSTSAHSFLAKSYFELGKYQISYDHFKQINRVMEQYKFLPSWKRSNEIDLVRAKVMLSEKDIDLDNLYSYENENKMKMFEGSIAKGIGEILLIIDDQNSPEAEKWIKKAIGADKRNGMRFNLGANFALYAELFKRKGDLTKAKVHLNKAIRIFKECGADGWVQKYEKELAAL